MLCILFSLLWSDAWCTWHWPMILNLLWLTNSPLGHRFIIVTSHTLRSIHVFLSMKFPSATEFNSVKRFSCSSDWSAAGGQHKVTTCMASWGMCVIDSFLSDYRAGTALCPAEHIKIQLHLHKMKKKWREKPQRDSDSAPDQLIRKGQQSSILSLKLSLCMMSWGVHRLVSSMYLFSCFRSESTWGKETLLTMRTPWIQWVSLSTQKTNILGE